MTSSVVLRQFCHDDEAALIELWEACELTRPWNNPSLDIQRKLDGQSDWIVLANLGPEIVGPEIVGSVMVGYDGHRGWINYLAVHPAHRKSGIGRLLMEDAETRLRQVGCPKINLQVRHDNVDATAFYEAIGFGKDNVVSFGKRLVNDDDQK